MPSRLMPTFWGSMQQHFAGPHYVGWFGVYAVGTLMFLAYVVPPMFR